MCIRDSQILRAHSLHGKAHIHDLGRVSVTGRQIHQTSLCDDVDRRAVRQTVRLRLLEPMAVAGRTIPRGAVVVGTGKIQGAINILGEPMPNEEKQPDIDFDTMEEFEFVFDIALAPEFKACLLYTSRCV